MKTTYKVSAEAEVYGGECTDEQAQAFAEAIQDKIIEYADQKGISVEVEIVPETNSYNNRSTGDPDLIAELDELVEINWTDWVPAES